MLIQRRTALSMRCCGVQQKDQQYYLFYSGGDIDSMCGVRVATSSDPLARPGSWFKYWQGAALQSWTVPLP